MCDGYKNNKKIIGNLSIFLDERRMSEVLKENRESKGLTKSRQRVTVVIT